MRNQTRTAIAIAIVLAVGAGAFLVLRGSEEKKRAEPMEIALQDDYVFLRRFYYDRDLAFRRARQLGVSWLRVNLDWARALGPQAAEPASPTSPTYDWRPYDSLIAAAAAHGTRVELDLTGPAPAWAAGNRRVGPVNPSASRFGEFAAAAAAHFRGRVRRYSIWNEPNYVSWISPPRFAALIYRRLYRAGYQAIKTADPRAEILIGETAPYAIPGRAIAPLRFLRGVTCVDARYRRRPGCAPLLADGFAHHPYDFENPPERPRPSPDDVTIASLDRLTGALDRLGSSGALRTPGGRPLDVFLTEFGYFRTGKRAIDQSRRAHYVRRAFELANRNPRVRQMLHYLLVSPPKGSPNAFFDTGLVSVAGHPKKPFHALAAWARARH